MASDGDESVDDATTVTDYSFEDCVQAIKDLKVSQRSMFGNIEVTRKAVMKIEHNLSVFHTSYKDHLGPNICSAVKSLNTNPTIKQTNTATKLTPQDRRRIQLQEDREKKRQEAVPSGGAAGGGGASGAAGGGGASGGAAGGGGASGGADKGNKTTRGKNETKKANKRTDGRREGCVGTKAKLKEMVKEAHPTTTKKPRIDYNVTIHPVDPVGRKTHAMANIPNGGCLLYECDSFVPFSDNVVNDKMAAVLQGFGVRKANDLTKQDLGTAIVQFITEMMNSEIGLFDTRPLFLEADVNLSTTGDLHDPEAFAYAQPEPFRSIMSVMMVKWKLLESDVVNKDDVTTMLASAMQAVQPYVARLRHNLPPIVSKNSATEDGGGVEEHGSDKDGDDDDGDQENDDDEEDNSDETEEEPEDD